MTSTLTIQQQQANDFSIMDYKIETKDNDDSETLSASERIEKFKIWCEMGRPSSSPTAINNFCESSSENNHISWVMDNVPRIPDDDLRITKLLGRGAFANVHQAYFNDEPFAIKRLRHTVVMNEESLLIAAMDLASEAVILSNLRHENIISILGIREGDTDDLIESGNFFIALELIDDTLQDRLKEWKKQQKFMKMSFAADSDTVIERIKNVVMGIVSAMQYLHSNRIVYRDMKPSNIGFNDLNQVKIFDFGFARVCNTHDDKGFESTRLMTGGIGTPRYMAPEVTRHDEKYGFPVDVYSFSLLLWQIVTTKTPFKDIKHATTLARKVVLKNKRPCLRLVRSEMIRELLTRGWSPDPKERPSFLEIKKTLDQIIEQHDDDKYPKKRPDNISRDVTDTTDTTDTSESAVVIEDLKSSLKSSINYGEYTNGLNDCKEGNNRNFFLDSDSVSYASSDDTMSFASSDNFSAYSDDGDNPKTTQIARRNDRGIRGALPFFRKKRVSVEP